MRASLALDKRALTAILMRLAVSKGEGDAQLYAKLMGSWGNRPDRERVSIPVNGDELGILQGLGLPEGIVDLGVLRCQWKATYRHPHKPKVEVVIHSQEKPPKRRTFSVAGGTARLTRVKVERTHHHKEAAGMATRTKSKKKAVEDDELDELEGLEDLDDLEDLEDDEDVDDEEPEDEDEEDEEEEAPKSRSRSKSKAKSKPAAKRKRKVVEEDDEEDDEDEDEDEDEPAPRKKGKTRQSAAKTKGKSSTAKKKGPPATRELPPGKFGPEDIASEVGCDSRAVRVFLRAHADEFPKDEESFRYAFNKRDFARAVKMLKKQRAE